MARIDEMAKAIFGSIVASLTAAGAALAAGNGNIDAEGWVAISAAFFATFSAVYFVPNKERPPEQVPLYVGHEEGEGFYDTRTTNLAWDRGDDNAAG